VCVLTLPLTAPPDKFLFGFGPGGELGPQSRTPEAQLSELIAAGVTTAVGILGTDPVSRSLPNLLFKVKYVRGQRRPVGKRIRLIPSHAYVMPLDRRRAINNDGLTAFMHTGAYRVPVPVLTTSVMDDIALIQEVVGVGEIAISDSRSSNPSVDELTRIASDARVGADLESHYRHCLANDIAA